MAATSHDFWLHNLTAPVWKRLHMLVYVAYVLLVGHVALGALQSERDPLLTALLAAGAAAVIGLHFAASQRERDADRPSAAAEQAGFVEACRVGDIAEGRARIGPGGSLEAFVKAKEQGKVRHIGFTGHHDPEVHLALLNGYEGWETVQHPVNLIDPYYLSFVENVLPKVDAKGLGKDRHEDQRHRGDFGQ